MVLRKPSALSLVVAFAGLMVLALIAVIALNPEEPPPPPPPMVNAIDCPFEVPEGERARCGSIEVPEQWALPQGRKLRVFFARTLSTGRSPRLDPIVVLNGGPGQAGTDLIAGGWERMEPLRRDRDIIYVDQRGTGRSDPSLYCRDLDPVKFWHGGFGDADAEACLKPIRDAGYQIFAFNTEESARDFNALRLSLGSGPWNLLGTSYGTILAMEMVRQDPAGVRSVVLNSPTVTAAGWLDLSRMAAIKATYESVFEACAEQPSCNQAYPDLKTVFDELAVRMTVKPLPLTYQDPRTGQTVTTELSFAKLLDILTIMVGSGDGSAQVPSLIWYFHEVATGNIPSWPELNAWLYMPYWKTMDLIAYGLNAAIGCREVRPWVDVQSVRAAGLVYQPYVTPWNMELDYDVFCPAWKLPPGPESLRTPVTSDRPVLLLTGEFDTLTPTTLAETIAKTLNAAQILRFHGIGHDVFATSTCAREAVARFIRLPEDKVVLPCVSESKPPPFIIRALPAPANPSPPPSRGATKPP